VEWGAELPHADERDRDITRLTVAFWNCLNAPKKGCKMAERMERNTANGRHSVWTRDQVATVRNE